MIFYLAKIYFLHRTQHPFHRSLKLPQFLLGMAAQNNSKLYGRPEGGVLTASLSDYVTAQLRSVEVLDHQDEPGVSNVRLDTELGFAPILEEIIKLNPREIPSQNLCWGWVVDGLRSFSYDDLFIDCQFDETRVSGIGKLQLCSPNDMSTCARDHVSFGRLFVFVADDRPNKKTCGVKICLRNKFGDDITLRFVAGSPLLLAVNSTMKVTVSTCEGASVVVYSTPILQPAWHPLFASQPLVVKEEFKSLMEALDQVAELECRFNVPLSPELDAVDKIISKSSTKYHIVVLRCDLGFGTDVGAIKVDWPANPELRLDKEEGRFYRYCKQHRTSVQCRYLDIGQTILPRDQLESMSARVPKPFTLPFDEDEVHKHYFPYDQNTTLYGVRVSDTGIAGTYVRLVVLCIEY